MARDRRLGGDVREQAVEPAARRRSGRGDGAEDERAHVAPFVHVVRGPGREPACDQCAQFIAADAALRREGILDEETLAQVAFDHAQSARPANSPVVVFTSTRSPLPMYSGTMISMPVDSLAGFGRLVAVPPLSSGGVSITSTATLCGSCSATGASSMICT